MFQYSHHMSDVQCANDTRNPEMAVFTAPPHQTYAHSQHVHPINSYVNAYTYFHVIAELHSFKFSNVFNKFPKMEGRDCHMSIT